MATHNGALYIEEQLSSILMQLSHKDEIIISDDSSTDDTLKIIKSFGDSRIKLFSNDFHDVKLNFEFCIKQANGKYIFLSDQDDVWKPNKVERMLHFLTRGYALVLSDASIFDSSSQKIMHESFFEFNGSKPGLINNLVKNSFIGCCLAFDSIILKKILPFPSKIPMHDSWIGLVSILFFKVKFVEESLVFYRKHSNNISTTSTGKSNYTLFEKVKFRYFLLLNLLKSNF
ncbi:MAG TPA: glycosyltransferase [Pedobacter sp.]|nr:glycosyltransferase [Pedobacter sp.]